MGFLAPSIAVLHRSLAAANGVLANFRRSGKPSIDGLIVVPVAVRHEADGDDAPVDSRLWDALIWAADLVVDGQQITPQRGDEIDLVDGPETYRLLPRTDDRVFRFTDPSRQQLRLYGVEVQRTAT
jgi:hypothetical protein